MKSKDEVLGLLSRARPLLAQEFGIRRLALFGSYARGDHRQDSDVDILVEVDPAIGLRFVDLAERIEAIVGEPVEVVSRRAISDAQWTVIERDLLDVA